MQRKKRLTKRERKAVDSEAGDHAASHIHCIACGRHLDPSEFSPPTPSAKVLICQHQSRFPACVACEERALRLIAEHDRTGAPVASADAWH